MFQRGLRKRERYGAAIFALSLGAAYLFREIRRVRRRSWDEAARAAIATAELSAIVEGSGDPIVSCSLESRVLSWNSAAEHLFGWSADEIIGKPISILAPPDRKEEYRTFAASVLSGNSVKTFTQRMAKDGHLVDVDLTISPVFDPDGRIVGSSGIFRDVTDRLRAVVEREELIAKLGETLRENELFVGVLGHDLRNPLSSIRMGAKLIVHRGQAPEEDLRAIELIDRSAARMARMIDQILDFTRSREGLEIPLERRFVSLDEAARRVIEELQLVHPGAKLVLEVDGDARGSWDEDRVVQILSNLFGNAVEHGGEQPITIRIHGTDALVELDVHNLGDPISKETMDALFEPFHRGRDRHSPKGLGLGLFIVRAIVQAHGGTIRVESNEAHGTTFLVSLPRTAPIS